MLLYSDGYGSRKLDTDFKFYLIKDQINVNGTSKSMFGCRYQKFP